MFRLFSTRGLPAFLLLVGAFPVYAQTGSLSGTVVDGEVGETLIGANVYIEELERGAATDLDGRFLIEQLPVGAYEVRVSYTGFETQVITGVEIQEGQTETLEVPLTSGTLDEVVVEARLLRNNEAALLRDRQKAAAVSDAISAETLSRSGASDASDAMGKVTGASVLDGKYLVMRGLQGRYLNVQLNGAVLPSANPDGNAVALDLFPSGLLDNIVAVKTFTPDQPGDFTGGSLNLSTREFPDRFTLSASASGGFNTNVDLGGNVLLYDGGRLGLLGGGGPTLPAELANGTEVPDFGQALTNSEAAAQLDVLSKAFDGVMAPSGFSSSADQSLSFSVGDQFSVANRPLGFNASFSWSKGVSGYTDGRSAQYTLPGNVGTTEELNPRLVLTDQKGSEEVLVGGLANMSYQVTPQHELGLNVVYNRSAESTGRYQVGGLLGGDLSPGAVFETRSLTFVERGLISGQLSGDHALTQNGFRVEWKASVANSTQEEPDTRLFASHYVPSGSDTLYAIATSNYPAPQRIFRGLDETTYSGQLDVTIPLSGVLGVNSRLKTGGSLLQRERAYNEHLYQYRQAAGFTYNGDPFGFFQDRFMGVIGEDEDGDPIFGNYLVDAYEPRANYDGDQTVAAGYLMADVDVTEQFRVIGGARLETTRFNVVSEDPTVEAGRLDEVDVLPALSLVYALSDQMNLRAAYGRTIARPSFRELAPFASFSYIGDFTYVGNPNLERTLIDNADLRWEWFTRPGEVLAASVFYKRFQGPIERVTNPIAQNTEIQFRNVGDGTVYGIELEARRRLDMLPSFLSHFEIGGNATLLRSEVGIADDELALIRAYDPNASDTRPLQGQSEYIVNLDLSYNSQESGTVVGLYYNHFGERLFAVGASGSPSLFEQPRPMLDLVASQRLPRGFTVKASAKNLLNSAFKVTQTFKGQEYVVQEYLRGRSFSLGLSYSF